MLLFALGGLMQAARTFAPGGLPGGAELAFGYLLLSAYFTGKIFNRLGFPKLTGYLTAGIVTGPFVLELVTRPMTAQLKVVNGVAVCLIALVAGSELNLKSIRPVVRTLRAMTLFAVIGAMFAIAGVLYAMRPMLPFLDAMPTDQAIAVCMMIGVALSAQSPAVVMALVAELRADGPLTQVIMASVVVADLVVILCYSVASAVTSAVVGGEVDVVGTAGAVGWELVGSAGFGIAVGMLLGVFLRTVQKGAVLFAVMVCVVVAEVGARIHLDPLIVMLAAGIWLENFSRADASTLLGNIEAAQLPVFLVFFALAGSKIDIYSLYASLVPVALIALARTTSFFIGTKIACKLTHAQPVVTRFAWFGLVPQAGLALALALLVQRSFPTFGDQAAVILFGVVGFNELTAPPVLRRIMLHVGEAGKRAGHDFAAPGH